MKVALDVEGVLSDTHEVAYERGENLDHSMIEEWHFPTDENYEEFMHVSQNLWHNHTHLVPCLDHPRTVRNATRMIHSTHDMDVVTHRHNVDPQVKEWLEGYDVTYGEFRTPSCEKDDLDYDVYIDDKPALAERIEDSDHKVMLLRDRPYNEHIPESDRVIRIHSLADASKLLVGQESRGEIKSRVTETREDVFEKTMEHVEENKETYAKMGKL